MFVKLLSGDLITLDATSLEETRRQLSDRLSMPRRLLKLIDPDTGEEAAAQKEMLYLFCENSPSGDTIPIEVWWAWEFSENVYELFEPVGSSFRPKYSPEEFEVLVKDKSYRFTEFSPRSRMSVFRSLVGFMICRVSPVFLMDYLPRLQKHHYAEEKNVVNKLLCGSHMNMRKIEHYSEEDADEMLYYVCKAVIPRFDLSIGGIDTLHNTINLRTPRTLSYFVEREPVTEEVYTTLLRETAYRVEKGKCSKDVQEQIEKIFPLKLIDCS